MSRDYRKCCLCPYSAPYTPYKPYKMISYQKAFNP